MLGTISKKDEQHTRRMWKHCLDTGRSMPGAPKYFRASVDPRIIVSKEARQILQNRLDCTKPFTPNGKAQRLRKLKEEKLASLVARQKLAQAATQDNQSRITLLARPSVIRRSQLSRSFSIPSKLNKQSSSTVLIGVNVNRSSSSMDHRDSESDILNLRSEDGVNWLGSNVEPRLTSRMFLYKPEIPEVHLGDGAWDSEDDGKELKRLLRMRGKKRLQEAKEFMLHKSGSGPQWGSLSPQATRATSTTDVAPGAEPSQAPRATSTMNAALEAEPSQAPHSATSEADAPLEAEPSLAQLATSAKGVTFEAEPLARTDDGPTC